MPGWQEWARGNEMGAEEVGDSEPSKQENKGDLVHGAGRGERDAFGAACA